MAELVDMVRLSTFINRNGPYIYYYDGKCGGFNHEVVTKAYILACKFPQIKVFQVDWQDKIRSHPSTQPCEMNTISLLFLGRLVEKKIILDLSDIDSIFKKAIECYNENIERRIKNQGINIPEIYLNNNSDNIEYNYNITKSKINVLNHKKSLSKKKITTDYEKMINSDENFSNNNSTECAAWKNLSCKDNILEANTAKKSHLSISHSKLKVNTKPNIIKNKILKFGLKSKRSKAKQSIDKYNKTSIKITLNKKRKYIGPKL